MILNGKLIAEQIFAELLEQIAELPKPPKLAVVLVGDNPASLSYIRQKRKTAEKVGIDFELFSFDISVSEQELIAAIQGLNSNPDITGFIVQLPLPKHINTTAIIETIAPHKDVDGFTAENIGRLFLG
ncbi:MAG: bifunctional methylenetetrahydrofolate dehydrogenase/methenyltetrahydrofolate cyclohydrolase, partial [Candidatus Gracilibacteria bacterium]|nr:bifunctional methylenetetrahydrofolate dehydrogenase/methenyltetrahydrofolate cyclohydrolase [Candidatus Gracilibacteria bacterium]